MTTQYLHILLKIEAYLKGTADSIELHETVNELKYELIMKAIEAHKGNHTRAAKSLGMTRTALLHYTLGKYKKIAPVSEPNCNLVGEL